MTSKALFALLAGLLLPAVSFTQERVKVGAHERNMEFDDQALRVSGGSRHRQSFCLQAELRKFLQAGLR